MANRIVNEKVNMAENTYEIEAIFDNYKDYEKTRNFICELNRKKEEPTPPKCVSAETEPPRKLQGMLYVLKDESMLELAKQVVNAVEYSVEIPTGLESLKFNRKQETRDRILELIDCLKTYADWRG